MLILTLAAVLGATLATELLLERALGRRWNGPRWALLPTLGGLVGALVPLGALAEPLVDALVSLSLGVVLAVLVGVLGVFRVALRPPPPPPVPRTALRARRA